MPPTLSHCAGAVKVAITVFLLLVLGGYAAAFFTLHQAIAPKDGEPELSLTDIEYHYHGNPNTSRFRAAIAPGGWMYRYLPPNWPDRELLDFFAERMLLEDGALANMADTEHQEAWRQRLQTRVEDWRAFRAPPDRASDEDGAADASDAGDDAGQDALAPSAPASGDSEAARARRARERLFEHVAFDIPLEPDSHEKIALTVRDVLEGCRENGACHSDGARDAAHLPLDRGDTLIAVCARDPGISAGRLARFTHFHALGFAVMSLGVMFLFAHTGLRGGLKTLCCALLGGGLLVDLGGWWLTKLWAPGKYAVAGGGAAFGAMLVLLCLYMLVELWLIPSSIEDGVPRDSGS